MNRRNVLVWLGGGTAVVGLGGYHQRRRLRRWSDRDALHAAQEIEYPTVSSPTYLRPTDSHLTDALEELAERVEVARERWPDGEIEADEDELMAHSGRRFERANATLEEVAAQRDSFGEFSAAERLEVLGDLRGALGGAEQAVALAELQRGERDRDDIVVALETLREEYEAVLEDLSYVAPTLSWAATAYGELDEWLDNARGSIRMGERYVHGEGHIDTIEPQYSAARAASARARLEDAVRFQESLEATAREEASAGSFEQDLEAAFERLEERTETIIEDAEFIIEDGGDAIDAYVYDILISDLLERHDGPEDASEKGLLALAARRAADRYAYALILPAFEDIPSTRASDDVVAFDTTGADVRDAKESAVAALEDRIRADGDDPLVRYLCAMIAERFGRQDRRLERHLESINEDSASDWVVQLERTRLRYLELEELTTVLPDVMAVVPETDDDAASVSG